MQVENIEEALLRVGTYLEETPRKDWVDSVTLEWLKGGVNTLEAFVFKNEKSAELVEKVIKNGEGVDSKAMTYFELYNELKSRPTEKGEYMRVLVPLDKVSDTIKPITHEQSESSNINRLLIHVLKDSSALIQLNFDKSNEEQLLILDKMTSRAIKNGGTLQTESRASLDAISPFLAKRMTGEFNLPVQEAIKKLFDPADALASGRVFNVR